MVEPNEWDPTVTATHSGPLRYTKWCEYCRGHFEDNHYDERGHRAGAQYGPYGRLLAADQDRTKLLAVVADVRGRLQGLLGLGWPAGDPVRMVVRDAVDRLGDPLDTDGSKSP